MCFAVYIGTDHPLRTSEWNEESRQFYLTSLAPKDEPAKQHFSKSYIYYAGSHTRCSCGFFNNSMVFTDDADMMREYEKSQQSAKALVEVLEKALVHADTVEVFVTWEGRQAEAPRRRLVLAPVDFLTPLQSYSDDADEEIRTASSVIEEQDFIVVQTRVACRPTS